jgi:transposase
MGKAYSEDLRALVLRVIDEGMSKMEAHRVYRVSRTTIDDWIGLRQQTGGLKVLSRRASTKARALSGEVFVQFAQHHAGKTLTLGQMALAWEQEQGQKLSLMTFSVALRRQGNVAPKGWTRKKRVGATAKGVKRNARPS